MSVFPTRILLATDGSEDAALARRAAVDLASRSGSELHVIHVWQDVPSPYAHAFIRHELHEQGQEILDAEVEKIEAEGGKVAEAHLRNGRISDETLELAGEIGAGLLVLGSRGLGRVQRILMGSHSEEISHHARIPVMVLRHAEETWPPARILVGDDHSEDAGKAVELASAIGDLFGIRTTLVHAYPPDLEASEEMLGRARQDVERRAEGLERSLGYRPETRMEAGDPAVVVLEAAREAVDSALVAVGSRGTETLGWMRLGSVSTKVVRAATGPVLVCPRSEPPAE
ncbi:MAG: universal stress protein [Rubrobacteraceae bacterium]